MSTDSESSVRKPEERARPVERASHTVDVSAKYGMRSVGQRSIHKQGGILQTETGRYIANRKKELGSKARDSVCGGVLYASGVRTTSTLR